jgi:hypothetical protein
MADSTVPITAGSGTNISTRTNASGEHLQVVMLGRDGNDGVLDPAALADALSNPTTLVFGALAHLWNGATWDRQRKATTFKVFDLAAGTAETTIWTPTTGKKFRLMGLQCRIGSTAAKLTFKDGTGGATILILDMPGNTFLQPLLLGQGILSATADNALTVTRSGSTTLTGLAWGCEE